MTNPAQFPRSDLAAKLASATVQVVFGYKESPTDWKFQRLPLYGDLQESFRERAETAALDLRDNRTGRPYDPEWDLKPDQFFYVSNQPPSGGNFFPQLHDFVNLPVYVHRGRVRTPNVWVIVAQLDDGTVANLGARITESGILKRTSKALRVVYRDEAFDALDETVITFKAEIDWIDWQEVMIVLHGKNFHALFRDVPALVAMVDHHLNEIATHVGIDNVSQLSERIKRSPAMAVKLSRIIERGNMHTRAPAVLQQYGRDFSIDVTWNGDRMVFDGSVDKQWNILRLLDEANTLGPVTNQKYETSSKTPI